MVDVLDDSKFIISSSLLKVFVCDDSVPMCWLDRFEKAALMRDEGGRRKQRERRGFYHHLCEVMTAVACLGFGRIGLLFHDVAGRQACVTAAHRGGDRCVQCIRTA